MSWRIAPVLRHRDVRVAVAFYVDKLGFACPEESIMEGRGTEGAIYAIARRDGVEVHLGRARDDHEIDPGRPPNALGVYLFVPDVEALHEELVRRGAPVSEPTVAPYGLREIRVFDPAGYHLTFGTPADE